MLQRSIQNGNGALQHLVPPMQRKKQREELEAYQDQVEENNESGFLAGLLVVVTAQSEEELRQRIEGVQAVSRENGVKLELYHWVQIKALNTALPIGCRLVDNLRAFLTLFLRRVAALLRAGTSGSRRCVIRIKSHHGKSGYRKPETTLQSTWHCDWAYRIRQIFFPEKH